MSVGERRQEALYREAVDAHGPALARLARACEADAEIRRDLLQDMHLALWRSLDGFTGRCSLRTWTFRVAHNTAASHVIRQRRRPRTLVSLEDVELASAGKSPEQDADDQRTLDRLLVLVRSLDAIDRQVMVSYLEGLDARDTAEITGLSPANVATKIHRLKKVLAGRFRTGATS